MVRKRLCYMLIVTFMLHDLCHLLHATLRVVGKGEMSEVRAHSRVR